MIHLSSKNVNVSNNAALTMTGAIRITSREKIYQGLGLNYSRYNAGIENFLFPVKFLRETPLNFFLVLFLYQAVLAEQNTLTTFHRLE